MLMLLVGANVGVARAAVLTQSYTVAIQNANWTNTITLPQFDTGVGTLVGVRFGIAATARSISRVENLDAVPRAGVISGVQVDGVVRDSLGAPLVTTTTFVKFTNNLAAYDGLGDFGGGSGVSNARRAATSTAINALVPPFTSFEGIGSYNVQVTAVGAGFCIGPANFLLQVLPEMGATVTVYYDYEEVVLPTTIGNLVWNDYNANGVLEPGEPGLAGVTVSLLDEFGAPVAGVFPTVTDSDGYYSFTGMPAGNYYVVVEPPVGFVATYDLDGVDGSYSVLVVVGAGEVRDDVDFGFAQLTSTLGDRVWIDVNGNGVQDIDEIGLEGVTVHLLDGFGTELTSVVTDVNGSYGFTGLSAGTYTVTVTGLPAGYFGTFDADGLGTPDSTVVVLGLGEVWDAIDFGYQPRTASVGDRVWQDRNSNGVQDPGEPGLGGLNVELRASDTSLLATTVTDSDGLYAFGELAAGDYLVVVNPPAGYLPTYDLDGIGTLHQAQVSLGVDEVRTDVDFGYAGGRLGDRVWADADADGVQDVGEPGIAGASVTLSTGAATTTDSNGYYSFGDLPAGTYTVTVTVPSGWVATFDADGLGTPGVAEVTLVAGQDLDTADFGYQLQTASLGDRVWRDDDGDGVQDSGETGLAGVTVELRNGAGTTVLQTAVSDANGYFGFAGLAAGSYVVTAVQPSAHLPTFDADGLTVPNRAEVTLAAGEARDDVDFGYQPLGTIGDLVWLDLDENGAQEFGVEPGLSGVVVTASGTGGTFTTTTDLDGVYVFTNLPPGTYTVAVTPIPGLEATYDWDGTATPDLAVVVLGPGEGNLGVDFGYTMGSNLSDAQVGDRVWLDVDSDGIQDPGEAGIVGLPVTLFDGLGASISSQVTGVNGAYLFSGLPAGTYTVVVAGTAGYVATFDTDGVLSANQATVILANGEQRLDVDFGYRVPPPPPGSIAGRAWDDADASGTPSGLESGLAGLPVALLDAGGLVIASGFTDAGGYFAFTGLVSGSYSVTMVPSTYWGPTFDVDGTGTPNIAAVSVAVGADVTGVDFGYQYAPPPGSLGDRVWHDLDGNGAQDPGEPGLGGVTVELRDSSGALLVSVVTDGGGYYGFLSVEAGAYTVSIVPPLYYDATGDSDGAGTPNVAALVLAIGQEEGGIDFGLIYNPPPALIGDRVWEDLDSDGVQDPGENGLAGLAVTLRDSAGVVVDTATTDSLGAYEFSGLAAGSYSVTVTPPLYYIPTADLDGIATTNVTTLSVAIGETNRLVDFGMIYAPPLGSLGDRVWLDGNSNGLQEPGEPGMTNIPVTLRDSAGVVLATTTTDSTGAYRFTGLSARTYQVELTVPPTAVATFDIDGIGTAGSATVALAIGEDRTDVDFGYYIPAAPLPGSIGNRVWLDGDGDGVQDIGEPGLAGAEVTLRNGLGAAVGTVTTDSTGAYEFTALEADTYTVTVVPPANHFATFDLDGIVSENTCEIVLTPGDDRTDVDFGYIYVAPDPMSARVGDRVWADVNGNGLAELSEPGLTNVVVELVGSSGTVLAVTTTAANGTYEFAGLGAGTYAVRVTQPLGYVPTADADGTATPNVAVVTLAAAQVRTDVDFGYLPPAPITIGDRVWVDANSNGVQDASEVGMTNIVVVLRNGSGTPISTNLTGANGRYSFTNLAAGTYTVVVTPPINYGPTYDLDGTSTANRATVTVVTGEQRLNVDFGYVFCPGTGRIGDLVWIDADGDGTRDNNGCRGSESGLPNATVRLYDVNGYLLATDVTDSNGRYQFTGLLGGTYTVGVTPPAGYAATYDLDGVITPNRATVSLSQGQTRNDVDFGYVRYGSGCSHGDKDKDKDGCGDKDDDCDKDKDGYGGGSGGCNHSGCSNHSGCHHGTGSSHSSGCAHGSNSSHHTGCSHSGGGSGGSGGSTCDSTFWRSSGGCGLMTPYDFAVLTSLRLCNDNGSHRDFTANLASNRSAFASWMNSTSTQNMARALAIQLATFQLNLLDDNIELDDLIATPGIGSGSMTAAQLVNAANAALVTDSYTPNGDPNRGYQSLLRSALSAANTAARR